MDDLYSQQLLAAAANIPPARRLDAPDASATKVSRVCGSEVTVDVRLEGGVVADFGLEASACALGQASASLMAQAVIGATPAELRQVRDEMRAMLKEGGAPPSGARFAALSALQPIRAYPQRHASTLLVFEALVDCLDQIEAAAA